MPFVNVTDQKIYYAEFGSDGMPVVFVHGAAANHLIWGLQVRALGTIGQAIAVDLPGHGKSDLPGCTTIDAYRDVVVGLLDALELERAVIVGHSMGGAIAQTLALSHPHRVAGLALIGTGARLRVLPSILNGMLTDPEMTAELLVESSYSSNVDAGARQLALEQFLACSPQVAHDDFVACDAFDSMARVAEIQIPTLIVCGREDRMTPVKYSVYLHSQIPNTQLVLIDNAGHSVMIEQAEDVNAALEDFVGNL